MKDTARAWLIALAGILSAPAWADDHPELTAADEAYSSEDFELAARLYRKDAELGVVAAQVNLAFLYLDGQGVAQDYQQAATWFLRAAEQGNREAQDNVGALYQDGKGVGKDWVEADKWFILAGARDKAASLEQQMSQEQVAEARRRATDWLNQAGRNGPR